MLNEKMIGNRSNSIKLAFVPKKAAAFLLGVSLINPVGFAAMGSASAFAQPNMKSRAESAFAKLDKLDGNRPIMLSFLSSVEKEEERPNLDNDLAMVPVKKSQQQATQGERRISIESEGKPKSEIAGYITRYSRLVDSVSSILKTDSGIAPAQKNQEERFITEVWGILKGNLNIVYGKNEHGFVSESLDTNNWDCKNSSFLIYDIAIKLGIEFDVVLVPGHMLLTGKTLVFETTSGKYYPISELKGRYPIIYDKGDSESIFDSMTYNNRGFVYDDLKQYEKAIDDYNKAIALNPAYADAYINLGAAHQHLKQYEKAIGDYNKAIALNPVCVEAYNNLGVVYDTLKQYEKAIINYKAAIALNPEYAAAYNNLGVVYLHLHQYWNAIDSYNAAIDLNSSYAQAYNNRGIAYHYLGQSALADKNFRKAKELSTNLE